MAKVTECPDCGAEASDARFCRMCGTPLNEATGDVAGAVATEPADAEPADAAPADAKPMDAEPADAAPAADDTDPFAALFRPERGTPRGAAEAGEPRSDRRPPAKRDTAAETTMIAGPADRDDQDSGGDATERAAAAAQADAGVTSGAEGTAGNGPTATGGAPAGAGDQTIVTDLRALADQPTAVTPLPAARQAPGEEGTDASPPAGADAAAASTTRVPAQYRPEGPRPTAVPATPSVPARPKAPPPTPSGAETTQLIARPHRQVTFPGPPVPPPRELSDRRFDPDRHSRTVMFIGFGIAIVAIVGLVIGFALLSGNAHKVKQRPPVTVTSSAPPLPSATDTNPYATNAPTASATHAATSQPTATATPSATTQNGSEILPGTQSDAVRQVQRELKALHLYYGKVNGHDTTSTVVAITRFQMEHHISTDPPGVVGPATAAALADAAH